MASHKKYHDGIVQTSAIRKGVTGKEQEVKIGELIKAHETKKDELMHDFNEKFEHLLSENKRLKK